MSKHRQINYKYMNPENNKPDADNTDSSNSSPLPSSDSSEPIRQDMPADALSRTPDELTEEIANEQSNNTQASNATTDKKPSKIKRFFRKINLYFLVFLMLVVIAGVYTAVNYINSQKEPEVPDIATQELTQEALEQLASNDASLGDSSQTLTIQGNAIINGQTLTRGNLNVAGNFQSGGDIQGANITIPGSANIGEAQVNSLQVASNVAIQGNTTVRDLSVSGGATFGGAVTAPQITVTNLVLSGNASLEVPNHIRFTGPAPSRSINPGVLGSGGSASVDGSDTAGTVNINTGGSPATGCFVRINFNQRFSNQPHVIISPVGTAAGQTQYYVDRDQAGFSICTSAPAPAHQAFAFDYFVTN